MPFLRKYVVVFWGHLVFLAVMVLPPAVAASYECKQLRVEGLFGVTPSRSGAQIFIFYSKQQESEELASGTPAILDVARCELSELAKLETLQVDSAAYWRKDGRIIFETSSGIVEVDPAVPKSRPKMIIEAQTHGLAVSEDESLLAFWEASGSQWNLTVVDLASLRTVSKWTLPFAYDGEANGFELAFVGNVTLYARTFDTEGRTPLKSFSLQTGKAQIIEKDCLALAGSSSGVFYIAQTQSGNSLKLQVGESSKTVSSCTTYNDLRAVPGSHWLAIGGPGKSALLDTESNEIRGKSACDQSTVLPDGTQLFFRNRQVSSDPNICARGRKP